ncbi:sorting nexin-25-like [Bacillus rossius redtenbacheri]|uniref:sorting nexin-25-like n=1 Tax=Bacillus rossius redtenbacheri TaxID=93214 RepID=UPI002FDCEEDE
MDLCFKISFTFYNLSAVNVAKRGMRALYVVTSLAALLLALVFQPQGTLLLIAMTFVFLIVAGVCINAPWRDTQYRYPKPAPGLEAMRKYLTGSEPRAEKPPRLPVIYGRMVDGILQQLMDLALRDYVGRPLDALGFRSEDVLCHVRSDVWQLTQQLQLRLARVDKVKLMAEDLVNKVTQHLERVRLGQALASAQGRDAPDYRLSPHLASPAAERDYLRRLVERAVPLLFPRPYAAVPAVAVLLREILVCKLFYPAIQLLTDPDFINQKIVSLIQQQTRGDAALRKPWARSSTFDDLVQMIKSSRDLDQVQHTRGHGETASARTHDVVPETTQASSERHSDSDRVNCIKEAEAERPFEGDKFNFFKGRQLKRYLSQLTQAKGSADKRPRSGRGSRYPVEEAVEASTMISGEDVVSLRSVLASVVRRRFLAQFLEQAGSQSLLGFWAAVEELAASDRSSWHQLGAEIFYTYVNTPSPDVQVDKPTLKRMEGFLLGDSGPEVFYEVRESVVRQLEELYPSFARHPLYQQMEAALDGDRSSLPPGEGEAVGAAAEGPAEPSDEPELDGLDHSNYAATKLCRLQERLCNKTQALQALRTALKPDSRVLSVLEKEVERLEGERRQLEAHLSRTEEWGEHLGQWRASVQSAELCEDRECPQFVLVVHVVEDESDAEAVSTGWVVLRKLSDFQLLHKKLCQLSSRVKQLDLPAQSIKYRFGKQAVKTALEKAKQQIQTYLQVVLEDEGLNHSEALYRFLSPSSEHLKQVTLPSQKKSGFSLATLFKSEDEEEVSLLLEEGEGRAAPGDKDGVAEPLYGLLGEVFDMKGVFKWLRRTLITFVQLTYDRTINRQVHETVEWLLSEQMMYFYIKKFIKSWWPNGQLVHSPPRSQQQKDGTREEARELLLANIPEVLSGLLGQQSARRGATKVFLTLQDQPLNKQLFYDLLEVVLYELCPEMKSRPTGREEAPVELPAIAETTHTPPQVS